MLTEQMKSFFDENGYLVINDVFDQDSIIAPVREEYSALLDKLIDGWVAQGQISAPPSGSDFYEKLAYCYHAGCDWFQPMDISLPGDEISQDTPMHFGPAIFDLITHHKLLDIIEGLIGPEITSNPIQHVRLKPPTAHLRDDETRAHITFTDWHQDKGVAHESADETDMITVWIAMTDATVENGCLQVIPRRENDGLLPHCTKTQTAIADDFINKDEAVPLPVRSGGIVLFHPLTPHSSLTNVTDKFRWSFDIRFNRTGQSTGREHFPEFIARSKMHPEQELHDWRVWRQMWEEARDKLSHQSHIPIHRWDSTAPYCA